MPYSDFERARRVVEPPKRAGAQPGALRRTDFARDRARILHSYAFRRLADKTQVVVPGEDDFPRTRLTHSLEVAQIGREIGAALGCDPDLVDAAGLAHDIGHPPFGHNGETALNVVAHDCGGFEGNAQTLRVLTRLEAKAVDRADRPAGLNLTRAVLDATCKYPWPRRDDSAKFGYYAADREAFDWLRADVPHGRRCLEAQVMDWADDVAYSVHDVEDGVHSGLVCLGEFDDDARAAVCEIAAADYSDRSAESLAPVLEALLDLPTLRDLADYDGSYRAQTMAKRATSELTGRFAVAAVATTRAEHGDDPLIRYGADLELPDDVVAECALLKAIAARYVMRRPGTRERQAGQRQLLTELVEATVAGAPGTLDRALLTPWHESATDGDRLRVVVDQVAQLTDTTAAARHAVLCPGDR